MGGPRRTVAQARQALGEAVDIIRASWAGEPFRYAGRHYQVPDAQPGPRPARDVGIWLGVVGPRAEVVPAVREAVASAGRGI